MFWLEFFATSTFILGILVSGVFLSPIAGGVAQAVGSLIWVILCRLEGEGTQATGFGLFFLLSVFGALRWWLNSPG